MIRMTTSTAVMFLPQTTYDPQYIEEKPEVSEMAMTFIFYRMLGVTRSLCNMQDWNEDIRE